VTQNLQDVILNHEYQIFELFAMMKTEMEELYRNFLYLVDRLKGGIWENRKFWKLRAHRRVSTEMIKWHALD
jgi:hypothetical protein